MNLVTDNVTDRHKKENIFGLLFYFSRYLRKKLVSFFYPSIHICLVSTLPIAIRYERQYSIVNNVIVQVVFSPDVYRRAGKPLNCK